MRIGYSYWGFLGDHKLDADGKEVSAPDGNATYGWSLIWEMQQRGHTVYMMQEDRDVHGDRAYGVKNFAAFSTIKRAEAYGKMERTHGQMFPELDVLLVEWRFPIFGRNCNSWEGYPCFPGGWTHGEHHKKNLDGSVTVLQPDLLRQDRLLKHYKEKGTKIIFWDLDHKVLKNDEEYWKPDAVFETSVTPRKLIMERTRVEPPFHIPDLLQHPTLPSDPNRKLVYIGSRYERDDVITEWVKPTSNQYPNGVEFHGNWLKTLDECKKLWPNVSYHDRCTTKDFRRIYGTAGACPLLAKKSYLETGFITPRPWEALLFGTLPVGLGTAKGIEQYVEFVAHSGGDMIEVAETLAGTDVKIRDYYRRANVERLEFMDARYFVDKVEGVVSSS